MDVEDALLQRLDRISFLLSLAFKDQIAAARREVLSDPVAVALLETAADDWVSAGDLKRAAASGAKQSERTVSRRLTQLVADGWMESTGSGPSVKYRSRGMA